MTNVPSTPVEPCPQGLPGSAPILLLQCLNGKMPCVSFQLALWPHRTLRRDSGLFWASALLYSPLPLALFIVDLPIGLGANALYPL